MFKASPQHIFGLGQFTNVSHSKIKSNSLSLDPKIYLPDVISLHPDIVDLMVICGIHPLVLKRHLNPFTKETTEEHFGNIGEHGIATAVGFNILSNKLRTKGLLTSDQEFLGFQAALVIDLYKSIEIFGSRAIQNGRLKHVDVYSPKARQNAIKFLMEDKRVNPAMTRYFHIAGSETGHNSFNKFLRLDKDKQLKLINGHYVEKLIHLMDHMTATIIPDGNELSKTYFVTPSEKMELTKYFDRFPWMWEQGIAWQSSRPVFLSNISKTSPEFYQAMSFAQLQVFISNAICAEFKSLLDHKSDLSPEYWMKDTLSEIQSYDFWGDKRVVVTGGAGFLGRHLVKELKKRGAKKIIIPRKKDHDLRNLKESLKVTKKANIVIHLAGNVGGIGYNQANPGSLYYDNLMMGTNILEASRINRVGKTVIIGTICSYPKHTSVPFKEEDLWKGYPEETNAPYGIAKKALIVQGDAYRDQYGLNVVNLLPVNLYGPGDNFDSKNSHVIPALIRKFTEAKSSKLKQVIVWGTGKATREFFHVEDAAQAIADATEKLTSSEPVNIGAGFETSIKDLVNMVKDLVGFKGEIIWDSNKPDGQPKRMLDVSKARRLFGFEARVNFKTGLKKTIEWYQKGIKTH